MSEIHEMLSLLRAMAVGGENVSRKSSTKNFSTQPKRAIKNGVIWKTKAGPLRAPCEIHIKGPLTVNKLKAI